MALTKIALDTNIAIEVLKSNELTIQVLRQFDLPSNNCVWRVIVWSEKFGQSILQSSTVRIFYR